MSETPNHVADSLTMIPRPPSSHSPSTIPLNSTTGIPSGNSMALASVRATLAAKYDVVEREIQLDGIRYSLLGVKDSNKLVDGIDPETFAIDERLPYWADLWPSAIGLARFCLGYPGIRSARVLDLGCGLGLTGIVAASTGAAVTMADYETDALQFAEYNAHANLGNEATAPNVSFLMMDWRTPPQMGHYDLILGADIIYEKKNFASLVDLLGVQLTSGSVALFADPDRRIGHEFASTIMASGFNVTTWADEVSYAGKVSVIRYYKIRKGSG